METKLSHSYPDVPEDTKVLVQKGFLEPFFCLLSALWQRAALPVAVCLYSMAASAWESFLRQDLGAQHSSLLSPATILSPQISISYKALKGFLWLIGALGSAGTVRMFSVLQSGQG